MDRVVVAVLILAGGAGIVGWQLLGANRGEGADPPPASEPTASHPGEPSGPPSGGPKGGEGVLPDRIGDYENRGRSEKGPVIGALYMNSEGTAFMFQAMAGEGRDTMLDTCTVTEEREVGGASCGVQKDTRKPICGTETAEYGLMVVGAQDSSTVEGAAAFLQEGAALMP
ncbi:MAG: hypothetical protein ACTH2Q_09860 [Propionibacteriaceae bacterium]